MEQTLLIRIELINYIINVFAYFWQILSLIVSDNTAEKKRYLL